MTPHKSKKDRSLAMLAAGLFLGALLGFTVKTIIGGDAQLGHHHGAPKTAAHHQEHTHHTSLDITQDEPHPTLAIMAHQDHDSGWNIHLPTTHFSFSAVNAGLDHVAGQGHIHLYINDEKWGRVYGNWVHVSDLPEGKVMLRAELFSNDHRSLTVDGRKISAQLELQTAQRR